jgi:hypothetical protein
VVQLHRFTFWYRLGTASPFGLCPNCTEHIRQQNTPRCTVPFHQLCEYTQTRVSSYSGTNFAKITKTRDRHTARIIKKS